MRSSRRLAATAGVALWAIAVFDMAGCAPKNNSTVPSTRSSTSSTSAPSTVTSVAGYPHITVPAGFFRGLPVGISFFGRAWSEPTLLRLAYAFEQATLARRPPAGTPALDGP